MVSAAIEGSEVSKIIIRLGGFHLLMSFLGAIGHIMRERSTSRDLCVKIIRKNAQWSYLRKSYSSSYTNSPYFGNNNKIKEVEMNDIMDADLIRNI